MELIEIIVLFLIGCLIGWIIELIYRNVVEKERKNPGFLKGPWLPIYGFGVLFLYLISGMNIHFIFKVILFISLPTFLELMTGLFLHRYFKIRLWDYSNRFLNYRGYICLLFSIYWGILGILFYILVYQLMVERLLIILADVNYIFLYGMIFSVFLLDGFISLQVAFRIKSAVNKLKGKYEVDFNKYKEKSRIFKRIEFGKKEVAEAKKKFKISKKMR